MAKRMLTELTDEEIVELYLALRERKKAVKDEMDRQLKENYTDKMDACETLLEKRMQERGVTSMKTGHGTPYIKVVSKAKVQDWDALYGFIKEQQLDHWLPHQVSDVCVQEYVEEHGALPPGVELNRRTNLNVRKA